MHISIQEAVTFCNSLKCDLMVCERELKTHSQTILLLTENISVKEHEIILLKMAEGVVQQIVDKVSGDNFGKIEFLVNRALASIFTDLNLSFKILSEIKRGSVIYSMQIIKDGLPGNINSLGGGIIVVVAVVLKLLFNIISKRFPILILDETLSFLAVSYIPAMSDFLKEVSQEFEIPILMVTHQEAFSQNSEYSYKIDIQKNQTNLEGI